ncbi:MAG: four-carbon acid sugar kinase family protein [Acidimicrobiia bacterium]
MSGSIRARTSAPFALTNNRALDQTRAVDRVRKIVVALNAAAQKENASVADILRGDSTLRGHVLLRSMHWATTTRSRWSGQRSPNWDVSPSMGPIYAR